MFLDSDSDFENNEEGEPDDPQLKALWAAEYNHVELLKTLLNSRPSLVNASDSDGYTPLHRASYNNHVDAVKTLLISGAIVSKGTNDGWQPLHCACRWNNAQAAEILLQNGADINARTNGGQTALHLAASLKDAHETISLLLKSPQVDATIRNNCNETAYQIAYRSGKHYKLFEITKSGENK